MADSGDRAVYVTGETTELDDVLQVDISSAKVMTITAHGSIQATQDLTPGTDLTLFFGKNTMYWSAGVKRKHAAFHGMDANQWI